MTESSDEKRMALSESTGDSTSGAAKKEWRTPQLTEVDYRETRSGASSGIDGMGGS